MRVPWRAHSREQSERDPAASMALLDEVLDRPVDPGYHTAAASRVAHGEPAQTSLRSPLFVISLALLGFLLSVAAVDLRTPDPQDAAERTELAERVEAQSRAGDVDAALIDELRVDIADLEAQQAGGTGTETSNLIAEVAEQAGGVALRGPGVIVTVDDAPRDDLEPIAEPGAISDRVLAADLQTLVNGLWAQGAEAISINDQRLTSTSSIRFAGEAIIVDFRGLNRPYVVRAIGDPQALRDELDSGETGVYFDDVVSEYGIVIEWEVNDDVETPAAERLTTRVAAADVSGSSQ
ncbi:MAG: DUF881 domain-containing protein [Ornithinimicrobium sp.]